MLIHPHIAISLRSHGTIGTTLLANEKLNFKNGLAFKRIEEIHSNFLSLISLYFLKPLIKETLTKNWDLGFIYRPFQ